jgi:hypothetical protein
MQRYRHIADIAIEICRTSDCVHVARGISDPHTTKVFTLVANAALHQENYATIPNYLTAELRYRDAGETRLESAKAGPQGTPGYQ